MPPQTLPTIFNGTQALYPVIRRVHFDTYICQAQNGTEQRWRRKPPTHSFLLEYRHLKASDVTNLHNHIATVKGAFDPTWQLVLGSTTYTDLAFVDDNFTWTEDVRLPMRYSTRFEIAQTISGQIITPAGGTTYPTFAGGVVTQLPYVRTERYSTIKTRNIMGKQLATAQYGGGLTGFPTRNLFSWKLSYSVFTDSEMATLEADFVNRAGRFGSMTFVDPDSGTSYPKVRYDSDVLEMRYVSKNVNAVDVMLAEYN